MGRDKGQIGVFGIWRTNQDAQVRKLTEKDVPPELRWPVPVSGV
jgi:hypothetical protein